MKAKLMCTAAVFLAVIAALTLYSYMTVPVTDDTICGIFSVEANQIEQLIKNGETELAAEKAEQLRISLSQYSPASGNTRENILLIGGISAAAVLLSFVYIWFTVIKPFKKLEKFADSIAAGNFDIPLNYGRTNYFGKFTWAFDSMRREIIKARACEREAIENNKTVIATLSHDIKTPVASIRAYAEGLEAGMDTTPEKKQKYLSVIMSKCDEVSRLTNDMFLHSLADLDKLKMNPEKIELCSFTADILEELRAERDDIQYKTTHSEIFIYADRSRLGQIIGNIVTNARKYAKTKIDIWTECSENTAELHFRDYGDGIPDEDIPFVFGKFYRGKNCGNEQGSGLGLYITKYIAEQSGGKAEIFNRDNGLEVVISFPVYTVS